MMGTRRRYIPPTPIRKGVVLGVDSDPGGARTRDLQIKSPLLCQLSYRVQGTILRAEG